MVLLIQYIDRFTQGGGESTGVPDRRLFTSQSVRDNLTTSNTSKLSEPN